jgi:hypothetical protein
LIIFKRKKSPPRKADFQALISEARLFCSGFYQNHVQELSGYTLSELEKEYEAVKRLKKAEPLL